MSEDRDTEQVSSTWLAQLRREYVIYGSECARLQKDLDSTKRMFENAVMTIVTIGEAAGVRGEDQQNGHLEIVEAINKIKGRRAVYKAKATELERELEVWRSGPVCWSCGDSGEVHSLDGEWRGECNCQGAVDARRIAELEADRDRIKTIADNYSALNMDAQAELAAIKAREPVAAVSEETFSSDGTSDIITCNLPIGTKLYAAQVSEAKPQGVVMPPSPYMPGVEPAQLTDYERGEAQGRCDMWAEVARINAAPAQQVVPDGSTKMQWPEIVALVNGVLGCEAHKYPCERGSIGHEMTGINFNSLARIIDRVRYLADSPAAPAADAGLVEALEHARLFIVNGIDLGFIQMPEAGTPDPAHETLPMIDAALAAHRAKGVV